MKVAENFAAFCYGFDYFFVTRRIDIMRTIER